jgi:mRNA turnover protein 4
MFLFPTPVLVLSWKNRFFLGSNKVLQIALGRTAADELKEDLHKVTEV